jgi:hypothetical protein
MTLLPCNSSANICTTMDGKQWFFFEVGFWLKLLKTTFPNESEWLFLRERKVLFAFLTADRPHRRNITHTSRRITSPHREAFPQSYLFLTVSSSHRTSLLRITCCMLASRDDYALYNGGWQRSHFIAQIASPSTGSAHHLKSKRIYGLSHSCSFLIMLF